MSLRTNSMTLNLFVLGQAKRAGGSGNLLKIKISTEEKVFRAYKRLVKIEQ